MVFNRQLLPAMVSIDTNLCVILCVSCSLRLTLQLPVALGPNFFCRRKEEKKSFAEKILHDNYTTITNNCS